MSNRIEALASEVLQLPSADRARLLDRVIASLDADATRDAAWNVVAANREAQIDQDKTFVVPLDDVLAKLRSERS